DALRVLGPLSPRSVLGPCGFRSAKRVCETDQTPRMISPVQLAGVLVELDADVQTIAPVDGFGLVLPEADGQVILLSRSAWGNNAYGFALTDLPAPSHVRPPRPD